MKSKQKRSRYPKRKHIGIIDNVNSPMYGVNVGIASIPKPGSPKEPMKIRFARGMQDG